MPLRISRTFTSRGLPPRRAGGIIGSTSAHSAVGEITRITLTITPCRHAVFRCPHAAPSKRISARQGITTDSSDSTSFWIGSKGNIKLNQLLNTTKVGAVSGAFWGSLIGLIFLMPLAGAAMGAASGALSGALTDIGLNDKWMKETAAAIQPGTAALFVLVRKATTDKVLEKLKGEGGTVMKTSLDHTKEAALQAALAGVQAAVPPSASS